MSDELRTIVSALTSEPDTDDIVMGRLCATITIICMAFQLRADNTGEAFEAYLVNPVTNDTIAVDGIHVLWSAGGVVHVVKNQDVITKGFTGDSTFTMKKNVVLRVVSGAPPDPCSRCGTIYASDLNRSRCEASHVLVPKRKTTQGKGKEDRTPISLVDFVATWDGMKLAERRVIASHASHLSPGILGGYDSFSAPIRHMMAFVTRKTDIKGPGLALALNEASEGTFMFRTIRAVQRSKLCMKQAYVSAVAHVIITDTLKAMSEAAAQRLLDDEDEARRKAVEQEAKRERARERRARTRLEQTVWKLRPIACWADEIV
jgi:hypothetical protein